MFNGKVFEHLVCERKPIADHCQPIATHITFPTCWNYPLSCYRLQIIFTIIQLHFTCKICGSHCLRDDWSSIFSNDNAVIHWTNQFPTDTSQRITADYPSYTNGDVNSHNIQYFKTCCRESTKIFMILWRHLFYKNSTSHFSQTVEASFSRHRWSYKIILLIV